MTLIDIYKYQKYYEKVNQLLHGGKGGKGGEIRLKKDTTNPTNPDGWCPNTQEQGELYSFLKENKKNLSLPENILETKETKEKKGLFTKKRRFTKTIISLDAFKKEIFPSNSNQQLITLLNNIVMLNYEKYSYIKIWQDNLKIAKDHDNELRHSKQTSFRISFNTFLYAMGLGNFTVPGTGTLIIDI